MNVPTRSRCFATTAAVWSVEPPSTTMSSSPSSTNARAPARARSRWSPGCRVAGPCLTRTGPASGSTRASALRTESSSEVRIGCLELEELDSAHQLVDPLLEGNRGREPEVADLLVRHDVVSLVGVLAEVGVVQVVIDPGADHLAYLGLAVVHLLRSDIVDLAAHALGVLDAEQEGAGYVVDVDERAHEARLVHDQIAHLDGRVHEFIHQKVETHPGGDPEGGGEAVGDGGAVLHDVALGGRLGLAVQAQGMKRRLLGADLVHQRPVVAAGRPEQDVPPAAGGVGHDLRTL